MRISIYTSPASSGVLSTAKDIATVVIAVANFCLAYYLFIYQRKRNRKIDNRDIERELQTAKLNEQNIKLQWFKELIIQPKLPTINAFYETMNSIHSEISSNELSTEEKILINDKIKLSHSKFRKEFVDIVQGVDVTFASEVLSQTTKLVDGITEVIFNDELKLKNAITYEKYISRPILNSYNELIAQIYNYKGL